VNDMPLTKKGRKVLSSMRKTYGAKKGKQVFYASMNKGKKGSTGWHKTGVASHTDPIALKALRRIRKS